MSKLFALILLASLSISGCSSWKRTTDKSDPSLPPMRMANDSVGLIIAVAEVPREEFDQLEELWGQIDSQSISLRSLKAYDGNGFRIGIAPAHLPAVFHELVGQPRVMGLGTDKFGEPVYEPGQNILTLEKKWNRSSEKETVLVSAPYAQLNCSIETPDGRRSWSCNEANCCFFLRTVPHGDGSVEVRLVPGLRYGQPRSRFTVHGDDFLVQTDQDQIELDELEFRARLRLGESLVIGAGRRPSGIGNAFFAADTEHRKNQRILIIRVVQTQLDDLFAPEKIRSPIATPRN